MQSSTIHNPDRYMSDLRQILSLGRKRIGILIGAGAPTAVTGDDCHPLIPDVRGLTEDVVSALSDDDQILIKTLTPELEQPVNIEVILTQIRKLAQAIGSASVHGLDAAGYDAVAQRICEKIGNSVNADLPRAPNPFSPNCFMDFGYAATTLGRDIHDKLRSPD